MRSRTFKAFAIFLMLAMPGAASMAGEAAVLDASARANADGTYAFTVTVAHGDEGWAHYADKWDIIAPDGKIIATRTLYHPHVKEQPFTRSLSRVEVPIGVNRVTIRAYDNVHGAGSRTFDVTLPPRK